MRTSLGKMNRASDRGSKRSGKKKSLTETEIKPINDGTVLIQKEESATGSVSSIVSASLSVFNVKFLIFRWALPSM